MFVGLNLVLQWVLGSGKVVRGDTKMSPGRVSPGVLQRGVSVVFHNVPVYIYTRMIYQNALKMGI